MKKLIALLPLLFLLNSCNQNSQEDCSTVLCLGPAILVFEVLQNGANVFEDQLITTEGITISGEFPTTFETFVQESNFNNTTATLLFIEQLNWEVRTYTFTLETASAQSPELSLTIELSTGDCCGGIPLIAEFTVNGVPLENPNQVVTINLE